MIKAIHHVAISTPDIEKLMGFYTETLGFTRMGVQQWSPGMNRIDAIVGLKGSSAKVGMVRLGDVIVEMFEFATPAPSPKDPNYPVNNHGLTHICLLVDDAVSEYERLSKAGMRFHAPPQVIGDTSSTYGRDPDGNVVEILELMGANDPMPSLA